MNKRRITVRYRIPKKQWNGYQHLMMWSRKYGLHNYSRLHVGSKLFQYLYNKVPPNKRTDEKVVWSRWEFFRARGLKPYEVKVIN